MLKLDSNGYIAHLLVNYGADQAKYTRDLCGVIRGLGLAFVMICIIMTVAVAISIIFFAWIVPLLAYGFTYSVWYEPAFGTTFVVFCLTCIVIVVEFLLRSYRRRREEKRIKSGYYSEDFGPDDPSIFSVWYDGFKNKYCPRVEFVDKSKDV